MTRLLCCTVEMDTLQKVRIALLYSTLCNPMDSKDYMDPMDHGPGRLLCPWNSPGKIIGVGSHFLFQGIFPSQGLSPGLLHCRWILYQLSHKKVKVLVAPLCLTLCDPVDCSPPSSSVHGISQARILEWVAISFSRGSYRPRD